MLSFTSPSEIQYNDRFLQGFPLMKYVHRCFFFIIYLTFTSVGIAKSCLTVLY